MDLLTLEDFTIETINYLIANEVEENIHLDYKAGDALKTNDKGKNEITKDVASFANSDGGIIIYGLSENEHKPTAISPFDGNAFTKERLDQIISNIQPHIKGLKIYPIRIEGDISRSIYVVKIPRSSNAPHMATDHKYYKRYNFQSVAMEDYEVRDLFSRADKPELEIDLCYCKCTNEYDVKYEDDSYDYKFHIGITNIGRKLCSNFKIALICKPKRFGHNFAFTAESYNISSFSKTVLDNGRVKFSLESKETIFPGESLDFSPSFEIPYAHVNQFLDASEFEIILWYDGGPKIYHYYLKGDEFSSVDM